MLFDYIRESIVKMVTPQLYYKYLVYSKILEPKLNECPRPAIVEVKRLGRSELVGAEIGVAKGTNAFSILSYLPMKKLYLIDPYLIYPEDFNIAKQNLKPYTNYVFLRETSDTAVNSIKESLDFCYIDGMHSFQQVQKDLKNYYPLVGKGGVLGGHDYFSFLGVARAVQKFSEETGLKLNLTFPDFWYIKK